MQATDDLRLREEFPPVPTADWEAAIRADLKGADYDKKLVWRTEEGIAVKPYYRTEDIQGLAPFPFARRGWKMVAPGGALPEGAVRGDLIRERGATAVQELGYTLADALAQGTSSVVFAIGSNYFFEIAKLRAARLLWARAGAQSELYIHARTTLSNASLYDPYTNLLRATTEALSAVIGGCDALEVRPLRYSERLALNVQRILKEESHLDKVADPAGGSYYIESLTHSMAEAAWTLMQGGGGDRDAAIAAAKCWSASTTTRT
jgi:methylmalonyl-CoA mutase